jgi:hypothetical protein
MIIRFLKRKFRRRLTDEVGYPTISGIWIENPVDAVLVNTDSGKVLAFVSEDGCDDCDVTVYVSPLRAFRLSRNNEGFLLSLRPLPRCAVKLPTFRSMEEAKSAVELAFEGEL